MEYKKITENDLVGKGVVGQPDTPALSALEMQNKVEEVVRDVVIPHFNELVGALTENGKPVQSGDVMQMRIGENGDLQISADGVQWLNVADKALEGKADKDNSYTKDQLYTKEETDTKLNKKAEADKVYTKEETDKAIGDKLTEVGAGDMQKSVYDTDNDGMVDNAKKLDGHEADYFMPKSEGNALIGGTDIPANSDLNSYTQPGNYGCYANAAAATLVNCPMSSAFILRVFATAVTGTWQYRWQELMPIQGSENYSYLRRCGSSDGGITWNWDEWQTPMPKTGGNFTGSVYMYAGNREGGNAVRGIWVGASNWTSVSTDEIQMIRK